MKHVSKIALVAAPLLGAACSSAVHTSGINQIGPDTYTTSVRAGRSNGGLLGAEGIALDEAGGYCRRAGKQILVLTSGVARKAYQTTFRCLDPSDPDLRRPSVEGSIRSAPHPVIRERSKL